MFFQVAVAERGPGTAARHEHHPGVESGIGVKNHAAGASRHKLIGRGGPHVGAAGIISPDEGAGICTRAGMVPGNKAVVAASAVRGPSGDERAITVGAVAVSAGHGGSLAAGSVLRSATDGRGGGHHIIILASTYRAGSAAHHVVQPAAHGAELGGYVVAPAGLTATRDGGAHGSVTNSVSAETRNHIRSKTVVTGVKLRLYPQCPLPPNADLECVRVSGAQIIFARRGHAGCSCVPAQQPCSPSRRRAGRPDSI